MNNYYYRFERWGAGLCEISTELFFFFKGARNDYGRERDVTRVGGLFFFLVPGSGWEEGIWLLQGKTLVREREGGRKENEMHTFFFLYY